MKIGLLLQIIGFVLFTPIIFNVIYNAVLRASCWFARKLEKGEVYRQRTGLFIARRYVRVLNIIRHRRKVSKILVNLVWTLLFSVSSTFMLIGLLSWFLSILSWIPFWLRVLSSIYVSYFIFDIILVIIWDHGLYRLPRFSNWVTSLPTRIDLREGMTIKKVSLIYLRIYLIEPQRSRFLYKTFVNISLILAGPIVGLLIVLQFSLLLIFDFLARTEYVRNSLAVLGWVLIITGLIFQYFST